ncbi:helix-turn-helix domain-containing protein [Bacillus pinisoli]|uniref:helix-turn-helix domain-containing protein n=1 Tax=Bacillus pinisoli TaxID=2901866 RepID=UPI001FF11F8C|nr:helix-turn-helix transcriptional regulator [Bacillus pinisoli]
MESPFGQHIRRIREQKKIGLVEFAKELGVSAGYLSNLETGKTENIKLSLINKLQQDLHIYPVNENSADEELEQRLERVNKLFRTCYEQDPVFAHYFFTTVEEGLDLVLKR